MNNPKTDHTTDHHAFGRHFSVILVVFSLMLSAFHLGISSAAVKIATTDDETVEAALHSPVRYEQALMLDYSIGRFYASWKYWWLSRFQALGDRGPELRAVERMIFLLLPAAAMWALFAYGMRNIEFGALTAVLWLSTYPLYVGYQPILSNPLLLIALASLFCSCLFACHAPGSRHPRWWQSLSLLSFVLSLSFHELFVTLLPIIFWARAAFGPAQPNRKAWAMFSAPYLLIILVYSGLFFGLKSAGANSVDYAGTKLHGDVAAGVVAMGRYSLSAIPGFEVGFNRSPTGAATPFLGLASAGHRIAAHARASDLPAALLAGLAACFLLCRLSYFSPRRVAPCLWLFALAFLFLPSALFSMTEKYQIWAHQRRFPYYYGGLGIPFLIFVGALLLWRLLRIPAVRQRLPVFAVSAGLMLALLVWTISAVNHAAIEQMARAVVY